MKIGLFFFFQLFATLCYSKCDSLISKIDINDAPRLTDRQLINTFDYFTCNSLKNKGIDSIAFVVIEDMNGLVSDLKMDSAQLEHLTIIKNEIEYRHNSRKAILDYFNNLNEAASNGQPFHFKPKEDDKNASQLVEWLKKGYKDWLIEIIRETNINKITFNGRNGKAEKIYANHEDENALIFQFTINDNKITLLNSIHKNACLFRFEILEDNSIVFVHILS